MFGRKKRPKVDQEKVLKALLAHKIERCAARWEVPTEWAAIVLSGRQKEAKRLLEEHKKKEAA